MTARLEEADVLSGNGLPGIMREAAGGAMRLPIAGIREKTREADTEAITASRIGKGVMGTPRDAEARPVRAAAVSRKDREMGGERKARKS